MAEPAITRPLICGACLISINPPVPHLGAFGDFGCSRSNHMGVARVPKIWGCWDPAPLGQRVRVADPYQYAILRLCYPAKFVRSGSNGTSICLLRGQP